MAGFSVVVFMSVLSFIFLFFVTIFLAVVLYIIINYIVESTLIMCICRNLDYRKNITAWIPFYNKYLLGKIAGHNILGKILAILTFISFSLIIYFYINQEFEIILFSILITILIISLILDIIIAHNIYKKYANKYSLVLTIFTILSFGLLRPIFLFILRNKQVVNKG